MITSKITGFIDLGNGPIEVQGEATWTPPPIDEETMERTRKFNESIRKMQQQEIRLFEAPLEHKPTGPIVESTLAEKSEECNEDIEHDNQR